MKRTFEMNGKTYKTITAIAAELGVKRIYPRDFAKYGITEITSIISKNVNILDDTDDSKVTNMNDPLNTGGSSIIFAHITPSGMAVDDVIDISSHSTSEDTTPADTTPTDTTPADTTPADTTPADTTPTDTTSEDTTSEDTASEDTTSEDTTPEDTTSEDTASEDTTSEDTASEDTTPEDTASEKTEDERIAQIEKDIVDYVDADELGKNIRKISLQGLIKMAKNIQVKTWDHIANVNIRKMRLVMELKKAYFPNPFVKPPTGPSPWKNISTRDLKATATAKNCVWKSCSNEGILRMRLIMALKAAGITANEVEVTTPTN